MFNNFFLFRKSCRLVDNVEKYCRTRQATGDNIWRVLIACWIPKATSIHSEYVICIDFPVQHWLHERASMLRYTHAACLVCVKFQTNCFNNERRTREQYNSAG